MENNPDLRQVSASLRRMEFDQAASLSAIDRVAGFMRHRRLPLGPVLEAYERYLTHHPGSANATFNLAYNLAWEGQFDAAIDLYERALELQIDAPEEVHLNIANILMDHLQAPGQARAHLEKALALNPGYAAAFYNLGNLAEQEGSREQASRCFEMSLKLDPFNESALARLADTKKFSQGDDPLIMRLAGTAQGSRNSDVHFALGRAYEQLGEFDRAWRHFSHGNALDEIRMPAYDPQGAEAYFDCIKSQCDRDWLHRFKGESGEHVFICGMFRSGSTLLEQMLGAHPAFTAGGESQFFPRLVTENFPDYPEGLVGLSTHRASTWRNFHAVQLRKLHGESSRITDKRPDNFLYLGLIKAVLPSAKFIVTERDWRDTATSIYSVRLGLGQPYATKLSHIRHYIHLQKELVAHWAAVMGTDLKRVSYEDLVMQPKQTMAELFEWLGEAWDESCLSFHELTNRVQTASVWQVREPVNSKSVGRWRNYRRYFVEEFADQPDS